MVRDERDRLATALTRSQTQLTSLQSAHLPQHALERFVRGGGYRIKRTLLKQVHLSNKDTFPFPNNDTYMRAFLTPEIRTPH